MPYTGTINEQNPDQMFPAVYQEPPPAPDIPQTSIPGAIFNAGRRLGASYTPPSPEYMARAMSGIAAQGGSPPIPDYLKEQPTTVAPVLPQGPASMAPDFNPSSHEPSPGRDYLAAVENSQRGFNAERDTPQQTAAQAGYVPEMRAIRTNPWAPQNEHPVADPVGILAHLRQRVEQGGDSEDAKHFNEYEKKLLAQVHSMLPGASPKEIRSVMTTVSRATNNPSSMNPTQPAQPGQQGPTTLSSAVAQAQQPAANYQKLGAGQSIYQMQPDGTARLVTTAPGGAGEQHKNDQFKELQKHSVKLYEESKKEYDKNWDQITKDVTDPNLKDKALRELNKNRFMSMGIPEKIAEVPESFTLFAMDKLKPKEYKPWETRPATEPPLKTKLTREEVESAKAEHQNLMRIRNILANRFYNNAMQFQGPGGTY